jgi:hypothetical protein
VKHDAIKELYKILKIEDYTSYCPEFKREQELDKWVSRWLIEKETSQLVMNKKYLTSEFSDIIKTKMAENLAIELVEDCVKFKTEDRKIAATILSFRRQAKP